MKVSYEFGVRSGAMKTLSQKVSQEYGLTL